MDVLVIGGGAIGSACARALTLAGAEVTLARGRELPGAAWRASAGMLAAQIEADHEDPLYSLGVAGRAFYRRERDPLFDTTGIDIELKQDGILRIATEEDQVAELKTRVAWQRQQAQRADWLETEEIEQGWPWLRGGLGGLWAAEDGTLDPVRLVEALTADSTRLGARLIDEEMVGLWREGDRLLGAIGESGRHAADCVVIAAGAWSGRLTELPRPLSVEPVKGQMIAAPWPSGARSITVYGDHCYLLKRGDELLAGATMEHAGFDATAEPSSAASFTVGLTGIYPELGQLTPTRSWAGLRPGTPDGLPILGPEPRMDGLWYATGHGRNGILMAGITGDLIAKGIAGEPLPEELHRVRPERFWDW